MHHYLIVSDERKIWPHSPLSVLGALISWGVSADEEDREGQSSRDLCLKWQREEDASEINEHKHIAFNCIINTPLSNNARTSLTGINPMINVQKEPEPIKYDYFISHMKAEAGLIAGLFTMSLRLERSVPKEKIFLDTEVLKNLKDLRHEVTASKTIICLMTKSYLSRPWCLIELYEALRLGREVLPVVVSSSGYDFELIGKLASSKDLKVSLDSLNPGSYDRLILEGFIPKEVIALINNRIPYLINKSFDPLATEAVKSAQLESILGAIR